MIRRLGVNPDFFKTSTSRFEYRERRSSGGARGGGSGGPDPPSPDLRGLRNSSRSGDFFVEWGGGGGVTATLDCMMT